MSRKIIGITVGTQLPKPNFKQTDPTKGDYIKNKPDFDGLKARVSDVEDTLTSIIDPTLYVEGKAADAKAVGESISAVGSLVGDVPVATQITDAISAMPQADWNQNDENAPDYVKNRTHYDASYKLGEELIQSFAETEFKQLGISSIGEYVAKVSDMTPALSIMQESGYVFYRKEYKIGDGVAIIAGSTNQGYAIAVGSRNAFFTRAVVVLQAGYTAYLKYDSEGAANDQSYVTISEPGVYLWTTGAVSTPYIRWSDIRPLDEKYIPDTIARKSDLEGLGAPVQPDWNQNDPTAADYVKGRTHYVGEMESEVLASTTVTFTEESLAPNESGVVNGLYDPLGAGAVSFVGGNKYRVVWDGKPYDVALSGSGWQSFGNAALYNSSSEDTGEPFYFDYQMQNHYSWIATSAGEHTVAVYILEQGVKTIDPKFLPKDSILPSNVNESLNIQNAMPYEIARYRYNGEWDGDAYWQEKTHYSSFWDLFSWDGDSTGLTETQYTQMYMRYCGPFVNFDFTAEDLIGFTLYGHTYVSGAGYTVQPDDIISVGSASKTIYAGGPQPPIVFVAEDDVGTTMQLGATEKHPSSCTCTFPAAGIWIGKYYNSPGLQVIRSEYVEKQLNEKYIPDTIARISDLANAVTIDSTLTIEGAPADAKVVGDLWRAYPTDADVWETLINIGMYDRIADETGAVLTDEVGNILLLEGGR